MTQRNSLKITNGMIWCLVRMYTDFVLMETMPLCI